MDACNIDKEACLVGRKFDIILLYFPHTGGNIGEDAVLQSNQRLFRGYLHASLSLLAVDGEVHLAVKTGGGYGKLNPVLLIGEDGRLIVKQKVAVDKRQFHEYVH
jgi:hypothetical protein